ncbi:hypothetical protein BC829DRAFT_387796, partial [Chytridium lagenaria]
LSWGSLFVAAVTVICGVCSFGGLLAARNPEKPTAIAALIVALLASFFIYLKYKTFVETKGLTFSITAYQWNNQTFNFIMLPLYGILGFFLVFAVSLELLAVGGKYSHKLHVYCTGEKQRPTDPIIWFEHGLGGQSMDFSWVQKDAATYGTCLLLRPLWTTEAIVDELDNLLKTNNIKGDLLMVGHSMAGLNTRVAQRKLTANKVVGIVLVDPVSYLEYTICEVGRRTALPALYNLGVQINTWGLVRLLSFTSFFPQIKNIRALPSEFSKRYLANLMSTASQIVRNSEQSNFPTSCGQTKELLNPPSDAVFLSLFTMSRVTRFSVNATDSGHVSILHQESEVKMVIDVTRRIFSRA